MCWIDFSQRQIMVEGLRNVWWNFMYLEYFHWLWVMWFDWLRKFENCSFLRMFLGSSLSSGCAFNSHSLRIYYQVCSRSTAIFVYDYYCMKLYLLNSHSLRIYYQVQKGPRSVEQLNLYSSAGRCMGLFIFNLDYQ